MMHSRASYIAVILLIQQAYTVIIRPPFIDFGPKRQIFKSEATVELVCVASGTPMPMEYTWFRNGVEFSLSSVGNVARPDPSMGTLRITGANARDNNGSYQCQARNGYGVAISDVAVITQAFLNPASNTPIQDHRVQEGASLMLPCEQVRNYPFVAHSWAVVADIGESTPIKSITPDDRVQIDGKGNLLFANVITGDALGSPPLIYKCNINNVYVDATIGSSYARIIVTPGSVGPSSPALAYSTDSPLVGILNLQISLRCIFTGLPTPRITWTKQGGSFPPTRATVVKYGTELLIKDLQFEDSGSYVCSADSAQATINLRVVSTPSFAPPGKQFSSVNVTSGDTVTMTCDARSTPDSTNIWYINEEQYNGGNSRRVLSGDRKTLTFTAVCKECPTGGTDYVVVSCNATNDYGYAFTSGYLNILDPTKITQGPSDAMFDSSKDLTFSCQATSDPSTPALIRWTVNDEPITAKDKEIYIDPLDGTLRIVVGHDPKRWMSYNNSYFECIASNGYSNDTAKALFTIPYGTSIEQIASAGAWWLYLVIILIVLLLLLLIFLCCCWLRRNKNEHYEVDKREKKHGLDPEKELLDSGFHDYTTPQGGENPRYGQRGSANDDLKLQESDDEIDDKGKLVDKRKEPKLRF